ncbi:MAG: hypothetical protein JW861_11065 [Bacteroidales bacterium]|nr:hypothetical protein [Bacteroidales bacterium]
MNRFDDKGMMIYPNPIKKSGICRNKTILVVRECYCQNGHSLISNQAVFNGFKGIQVMVRRGNETGLVALSPVYGYKSRVTLNVLLEKEQIWEVCCPQCGEPLAVFSRCSCGGDLFTLFLNREADFANCILLCNRIDCFNAEIKFHNEILHYSGMETVI